MPSIARTLLLAVYAVSFLALTGISPATTTALASPLVASLPAVSANSPRSLLAARVVSKHTDAELVARMPTSPAVSTTRQPKSTTNTTHTVKQLDAVYGKMQGNAAAMKSLATQARARAKSGAHARSAPAEDDAFQQQCVSELDDYRTNLDAFQQLLVLLGLNAVCGCPLTLDEGLACYDPQNDVDKILKGVVNVHKCILENTAILVNSNPLLKALLGPIVDALKCLVDEILDAVENLVDCILRITTKVLVLAGLQGLLQALCPLGLCLL
ncbi:hypothetical protein MSAN_02160500 [Mycena sanguinolenta]|uniref:Uncharacterized protein n=1 Tax=Mycena sanguinolenta TaxID=230812 RepID=A0A8H7CKM7_9AGAR|nr:hypothetical protein MSAN_02160500 [Mycena sanguinolenta]